MSLRRRGYTLFELVVIIGVVGFLIIFAFRAVSYFKDVREAHTERVLYRDEVDDFFDLITRDIEMLLSVDRCSEHLLGLQLPCDKGGVKRIVYSYDLDRKKLERKEDGGSCVLLKEIEALLFNIEDKSIGIELKGTLREQEYTFIKKVPVVSKVW